MTRESTKTQRNLLVHLLIKLNSRQSESKPVKDVGRDEYKFYCLPCGKTLACHHQGDIKKHCTNNSHKTAFESWKKQKTLFFNTGNTQDCFQNKVTRAEVIVSNFLVQHNLPLATTDHLGSLFSLQLCKNQNYSKSQ